MTIEERRAATERAYRRLYKPHVKIYQESRCPHCNEVLSPQGYGYAWGGGRSFFRSFRQMMQAIAYRSKNA